MASTIFMFSRKLHYSCHFDTFTSCNDNGGWSCSTAPMTGLRVFRVTAWPPMSKTSCKWLFMCFCTRSKAGSSRYGLCVVYGLTPSQATLDRSQICAARFRGQTCVSRSTPVSIMALLASSSTSHDHEVPFDGNTAGVRRCYGQGKGGGGWLMPPDRSQIGRRTPDE